MTDIHVDIRSRRLVCENQKFHVYFDHVVDKAGNEVPDYLVVSPKQQSQNLVTGVAILPIVQGSVGLVRIYRPALRAYSWEIPHGFVEADEHDQQASTIRELSEETGLKVSNVESLGFITPDAGIIAGRVHLFLAVNCEQTGTQTNELGLKEFSYFSVEEFERMVENSVIQDTFTLAAWCRYLLRHKTIHG
jgi:ADP-ribose pyrophosphatase YjhB (NUDIX family)